MAHINFICTLNEGGVINDTPLLIGVLYQGTTDITILRQFQIMEISHNHFYTQELGPSLDHGNGLSVAVLINEEGMSIQIIIM